MLFSPVLFSEQINHLTTNLAWGKKYSMENQYELVEYLILYANYNELVTMIYMFQATFIIIHCITSPSYSISKYSIFNAEDI